MAEHITRIKQQGKEIILIGTAHISKESIELVKKTIEEEKPDNVGVELCKSRYDALNNKKEWNNTKVTEIIKKNKTYLFLSNLLLSIFEKKMGTDVDVKPGSEMLEAIRIARDNGTEISLIDRDVQITLQRAWKSMGLIEKGRLIFSIFEGMLFGGERVSKEQIEKMKDSDMINEMLEDLGRQIPKAKNALIDERDLYIAEKINEMKGKKVIAVVGAGHVSGIKRNLKKKTDLKKLENIPKGSSLARYIGWSIPVIFLAIIIYGFIGKGTAVTIDMLSYWFLINGLLSALGTAIALASPITILSAFIAAPITSLNPMIGAGWVAGLVEAKVREPRVKDFDSLAKLSGIKELWRNRVTRVFLVVVLANLGSSAGTFIALPYLMSLI